MHSTKTQRNLFRFILTLAALLLLLPYKFRLWPKAVDPEWTTPLGLPYRRSIKTELIGPVSTLYLDKIDWVIVGGESGPAARPL